MANGGQGVLIGYEQVMKNIKTIFEERVENVHKLFIKTGQEMLRDFRGVQYSAMQLKSKTKSQDEDTANENVRKAIDYAEAHSGNETSARGISWVNRTFRAARAVNVIVDANQDEMAIRLSHGIYYGAYLEYAHNRKYAILEPLIRQYAPKLLEETKRIMGGDIF
jgi:hypothetical protein